MKAVLRIVSAYFSFLPLQRWVNVVGAVVLATGLVLTLRAPDPKTSFMMTDDVALPGAILLVILPLALGGMAMRFASSRNVMHLRPHGRARMLLGATLTITLLAAITTLPELAQYHAFTCFCFHGVPVPQPAGWFLGALVFATTAWLVVFMLSASRTLFLLISVLPTLLIVVSHRVRFFVSASTMATLSVAIWAIFAIIFAIWYSRVARINRPDWMGGSSPPGFGNLFYGTLKRFSSIAADNSHARALRQYLFGRTFILTYIPVGALPAVLVLAMLQLLEERRMRQSPASFMFMFTLVATSLSYMIVRRTRYLWLRTGLDRLALFRLAERLGLPATLLMFCSWGAILLAGSIPGRQEQMPSLVLYAATLGILTACLFYYGLSLTRSWNTEDVICGIGLGILLLIIHIVIHPNQKPSTTTTLIAAGLLALLTLLLRWHARRRWRALDWRVARLPMMNRQPT